MNRSTLDVNSLPKTVTQERRGCDLNPGPTAPESSNEMVHSEVYLNKYIVVSIAPFSTPAFTHPTPIQKTALFACFRFLIFHPFFQRRGEGGQLTPFAPICGRLCIETLLGSKERIPHNETRSECQLITIVDVPQLERGYLSLLRWHILRNV